MPGARVSRAAVGSWAVPASVLLVAAVSPFERSLSVPIGGFTVTTLELAVTVAIACGAFAFVRSSSRHDWHTPITAPALAIFASPHDTGAATPDQDFDRFDEAMTERQARAFERGVPRARVLRWPRASHYLFLTREADVVREVTTFVTSLVR